MQSKQWRWACLLLPLECIPECLSAAPSQCPPQQHPHAVPQLPLMLSLSSTVPLPLRSTVPLPLREAFSCYLTAAFPGSSPSAAAPPCCSPTAIPGGLPAASHCCPSKASSIPLLSACSFPHINRAGLAQQKR